MMEELYTTENLVTEVLRKYPETRNSDPLLYVTMCKMINPKIGRMTYEKVMLGASEYGLPNYDSVSRVRRKVQAKNEELRGADKVTHFRYLRWKVFKEYATE